MSTQFAYRAFRIAYDGRGYHGFQRQPDVPTIDGAIIDAFAARGVDVLDSSNTYAAAGRTDAGVSALAQTIVAECPRWLTPSALNGELPSDIHAWASSDVDDGFHPRYDAHQRAYSYFLYGPEIDVRLAREVAGRLEGPHDFRNLTPTAGESQRSITSIDLRREGDFVELTVRAPGFLHQQVRRIASLVHSVSTSERPLAFVDRVLSGEDLDGPEGIPPAPAESLVLRAVEYPDRSFSVDKQARERARRLFTNRAIASQGAGLALQQIAEEMD